MQAGPRKGKGSVKGKAAEHAGPLALTGWVLFDWAAQPFFTLIITFVYAPYFASAIASDPVQGQALWGFATAAAGFTVAALSPVLGSIADASGRRKPWIAAFGVLDELHEVLFIPGRAAEVMDWLMDAAGSWCGLFLAYYLKGKKWAEPILR